MLEALRREIPESWKRLAKKLLPGRYPAYCPVCDSRHDEFSPFGDPVRQGALCPECKGLERHRFLWTFLKRRTAFGTKPMRLLHLAPEPDFGVRLSAMRGVDYISTDLMGDRRPHVRCDLTRSAFRDRSFDAIICSHVLEHIPDDRAAMRECRRMLRLGGWLVVQVPIRNRPTEEEPTINDPVRQRQLFGQEDHVRLYGLDIVQRLESAGFTVSVYSPRLFLTDRGDQTIGVPASEPPIFFCEVPASSLGNQSGDRSQDGGEDAKFGRSQ